MKKFAIALLSVSALAAALAFGSNVNFRSVPNFGDPIPTCPTYPVCSTTAR